MTDYEKALAEYLARQPIKQCPDASDVKQYKALRRNSFKSQKEKQNKSKSRFN